MANFAFQAFNIGKDVSVTINIKNILGATVKAGGSTILDLSDIGYLEKFGAKPTHTTLTAKPISHGGVTLFRDKFEHWEGSFSIIRTGIGADLLIQVLQDALLASEGGAVLADITQTVIDPRGASNGHAVFQFANSTLTPDAGGDYENDNAVMQMFTFRAPKRDLLSVTGSQVPVVEAEFATYLAALSAGRA